MLLELIYPPHPHPLFSLKLEQLKSGMFANFTFCFFFNLLSSRNFEFPQFGHTESPTLNSLLASNFPSVVLSLNSLLFFMSNSGKS